MLYVGIVEPDRRAAGTSDRADARADARGRPRARPLRLACIPHKRIYYVLRSAATAVNRFGCISGISFWRHRGEAEPRAVPAPFSAARAGHRRRAPRTPAASRGTSPRIVSLSAPRPYLRATVHSVMLRFISSRQRLGPVALRRLQAGSGAHSHGLLTRSALQSAPPLGGPLTRPTEPALSHHTLARSPAPSAWLPHRKRP